MALHLHRARSTRQLADGLAGLLSAPLPDAFAQDVVVVPARGVERWLAQSLSHRLGVGSRGGDGVCAGIRFLNPHALGSLLLGIEDHDPWHPDRLAWSVLAVLDASLAEAWCRPVAVHLGADREGVEARLRRNRRFSLARRVAGLFSSYAAQRPQLLTDWREGRDTDGAGGALPPDLAWQAELWRRIVAASEATPPDLRHLETLARLEAGGDGLDLPDRLSLFGHTRLTRPDVELLLALAGHREVHLWLPHPSPGLWTRLAGPTAAGPVRRRSDDAAGLDSAACAPRSAGPPPGHPLLASLGRDLRELQRTLAGARDASDVAAPSAERPAATLLGWLQDDLAADAAPDAALRRSRRLTAGDDSVQVHACHGLERQVGVLREVLTGLMADDETLEPRDVLVMTPDVEAVAPLIQGAFGLGPAADSHPAHGLRVRLADRGLAGTNPLLALAVTLVELAAGRATASEVLDLAAAPVVRARFGFTDAELAQLQGWVGEAAIRWGLTPGLRAPFGLDGLADNTWERGLARLLLGAAMADEEFRTLGETVPVDAVSSGAIDLVGRFAEFVSRLEAAVVAMESAGDLAHWVRTLGEAVRALGAVDRREAWQVSQFERELASVLDEGTGAAGGGRAVGPDLRLPDVRALLDRRVAARPTRANFRTGALTVCTMVPMRSVPHRIVVLLGVDDTVFPRSHGVDGDDVLARDPVTGERDPHSEDRQLFLDAIMAAGDKLVITYSGFSEHTGDERPPTVPLGELLDALDGTATAADGGPVSRAVRSAHPLQPFDERNFDADRPFSFDRAACAGALEARRQRPAPEFLTEPLPAPGDPETAVSVADLKGFFANPAAAFLSELDVARSRRFEEIRDAIPIDLDGLERWSAGDWVLRAVLAGADPEAVLSAELRRGHLPPGELGEDALRGILQVAQPLIEETAQVRDREPESVDIDVDLDLGAGPVRLGGTVGDIFRGCHIVRVGYSAVGPRHLLDAWLDLLALTASRPEDTFVAHCLGRAANRWSRSPIAHVKLGPVAPRTAREELATLLRLRAEGLRAPLRLPLATGHAWAVAHRQGKSEPLIVRAADEKWSGRDNSPVPGEAEDPAWVRVLGEATPLAVLTRPPDGDGLGSRADAVWLPLLDAMAVVR